MAKQGRDPKQTRKSGRQWRRLDLHIHTPASNDYQEPFISYLDILRQAEARSLDIIAFTDHNAVGGYRAMREEIEQLALLEKLDRLKKDEERRLNEYRRLLDKILVLPGFEFTATFGFHILGIFSPSTPMIFLEHLLLSLNVPLNELQKGSSTVGATSDVLTAYREIYQNGGLVIAAHANSSNGVIMRGLDFGGQTKIAYTQDPHLHCLEVTDLEKGGRYTTRRFYDGSKPEYPRAMRCIQGSDAHRLVRDFSNSKNLGVGDRVTEILLAEDTFEALYEVLSGSDFSLTRPYRGPAKPLDFVMVAREEGPSIVQSFHESLAQRGGHINKILEDACAMANTNGGTIYVGISADTKQPVVGVRNPSRAIDFLEKTISKRITPDPQITIDNLVSQGKTVVRLTVPPGKEIPYAIDDNRFFVRDEAETTLAVRDEIVRLVERRILGIETLAISTLMDTAAPRAAEETPEIPTISTPPTEMSPPRTGVEIVKSEERDGTIYHTVRDLRNGNLIHNVTRSSARKLWRYAITQTETNKQLLENAKWHGNMALLDMRKRDGYTWYDLALKHESGVNAYFGVTDSGLNDEWMEFVEKYAG